MFQMESGRAEIIKVPKAVRGRINSKAQQLAEFGQTVKGFSGRKYDAESVALHLVGQWAFSRWCVNNQIYHQWSYSDSPNDFTCEGSTTGQMLGICTVPFESGWGFNEATDGIRLSRYRLMHEECVALYLCMRFDGSKVHFYGAAEWGDISHADIFALRPTVYEVPVDHLQFTVDDLLEILRTTTEQQQVLEGVFD